MHVGGHRSDAGQAEIEWLGETSELDEKGQEESPHARVDVTQDPSLLRQRRDIGDRVDNPVRVRRRRADHHDRRVRARSVECVDVDSKICADGNPDQLDVEVVGGLGERGVRALGRNDPGMWNPAFVACHVPGRLDCLQEALGATRREVSLDASATRRIIGPEQCGRVPHDVVLHETDAGKGQHVEPVFGTVERECILEELMHLVAGGVHQAEHAAAPPVLVVLFHGQQLRQNLFSRQAVFGNRRMGELVHGDPCFLGVRGGDTGRGIATAHVGWRWHILMVVRSRRQRRRVRRPPA